MIDSALKKVCLFMHVASRFHSFPVLVLDTCTYAVFQGIMLKKHLHILKETVLYLSRSNKD